jgi:hypothetical protein
MVRFTEIFNASLERTACILFRPFSPKKWLLLSLIAILAGALIGGEFNFQLPRDSDRGKDKKSEVLTTTPAAKETQLQPKEELKELWSKINHPLTLSLVASGMLLILFLLIFTLWVSCRFAFIFLEDIVKNDASIKAPFKENKKAGNSLFLFSLALATIFLFLLGALVTAFIFILIRIGVFSPSTPQGTLKFLFAFLPFMLLFVILMIIYGIILLVVRDFLLPIMYREGIRITEAWQKFFLLFKANKLDFFKFILLRIVVQVIASFISGIIAFMTIIGLILPTGLCALIFYLLYLATPGGLRLFYFVFLGLFCVPLAAFLIFCLSSLYLPFSVLLRVLSVKFLGRLDSRYDLFQMKTRLAER